MSTQIVQKTPEYLLSLVYNNFPIGKFIKFDKVEDNKALADRTYPHDPTIGKISKVIIDEQEIEPGIIYEVLYPNGARIMTHGSTRFKVISKMEAFELEHYSYIDTFNIRTYTFVEVSPTPRARDYFGIHEPEQLEHSVIGCVLGYDNTHIFVSTKENSCIKVLHTQITPIMGDNEIKQQKWLLQNNILLDETPVYIKNDRNSPKLPSGPYTICDVEQDGVIIRRNSYKAKVSVTNLTLTQPTTARDLYGSILTPGDLVCLAQSSGVIGIVKEIYVKNYKTMATIEINYLNKHGKCITNLHHFPATVLIKPRYKTE